VHIFSFFGTERRQGLCATLEPVFLSSAASGTKYIAKSYYIFQKHVFPNQIFGSKSKAYQRLPSTYWRHFRCSIQKIKSIHPGGFPSRPEGRGLVHPAGYNRAKEIRIQTPCRGLVHCNCGPSFWSSNWICASVKANPADSKSGYIF